MGEESHSCKKSQRRKAALRAVRRWFLAIGILFVVTAWIPELMGIGAPGLGSMQWAILVLAASWICLGLLLGRMDGRPLALLFVTAMGIAGVLGSLSISHVEPGWLLWRLKAGWLGPESLNLHQDDPLLGWRNFENADVVDRHYDFEANYHTDRFGFRWDTGAKAKQDDAQVVLCLGGSFTFGQGVADSAAYPNRWNALADTELCVVNAGVNGFGTVQCCLQLRTYLDEFPAPDLVTYGFIPAHVGRNSDRNRWLETLSISDRGKPVIVVENGNVIFDRLVRYPSGVDDTESLRKREMEATRACIVQMKVDCDARGSEFWLLYLGNDSMEGTQDFSIESMKSLVDPHGIRVIDMTALEASRFAHDGHPTSTWHAEVAELLNHEWEQQNAE